MENTKNILFVSHDGNRAGAQLFLFNIMHYFKERRYGVVLLILNNWGTLREQFESNFETYYFENESLSSKTKKFKDLLSGKKNQLSLIHEKHNIDLVYVNTIASVGILPIVSNVFKKPIISHIHELSYSIQQYGPKNSLQTLLDFSNKVIACSRAVKENLVFENQAFDLKTEIIHSFVDNESVLKIHELGNKSEIESEFGIGENIFIVGACGNADWRKAPDIFLSIVKEVTFHASNIKFIWIGINKNDELFSQLVYDAKKLDIENNIVWVPPTPKAISIINALDVFLICSREDPFPLVMLEAALCEKPIVGFKNTGGAEEFVEMDCGFTSFYLNISEISANILQLYKDSELARELGKNAQKKVLSTYSFEKSVLKIQELIQRV